MNTANWCKAVGRNIKFYIQDEKKTEVEFVEFWYAQKNGKWVLNTAYPSGLDSPVYACKKIPRPKVQENKLKYIFKI